MGDLVYWHPHGLVEVPPHCGVVTKVYHQSICINLFDPSSYSMLIRDGVKHVNDPTMRDEERKEMGGWSEHPLAKRLRKVEEEAASLSKRTHVLESRRGL